LILRRLENWPRERRLRAGWEHCHPRVNCFYLLWPNPVFLFRFFVLRVGHLTTLMLIVNRRSGAARGEG
jgi:hypothetical protein